jgi:hypothetical protein
MPPLNVERRCNSPSSDKEEASKGQDAFADFKHQLDQMQTRCKYLLENERSVHTRKCNDLQELLGTTEETLSKKSLQLSKAMKEIDNVIKLLVHERTAGKEETKPLEQ